jgi:sugar phosphate isomerase/epimerase
MNGPRIGVCSWSLRPSSPDDLVKSARAAGFKHVQLALCPIRTGLWDRRATIDAIRRSGLEIISGMMAMEGEDYSTLESIRRTGGVRPDDRWEMNLSATETIARVADSLGIRLVTFHAGFLPEGGLDPERSKMLDRLATIARTLGARGIRMGLETGQESAGTLLDVLRELDGTNVGVNLDPANMILYGTGDPVDALRKLAPHVVQIHIKDARPAATPGTWGTEVVAGTGAVNWPDFFEVYRKMGLRCDLVGEREAGENRIEDAAAARKLVESHFPPGSSGGGPGR